MDCSRRSLLKAGGVTGATMASGCLSVLEGDGVSLGPVLVRSAYDSVRFFRVEVERGGEVLLEETVESSPEAETPTVIEPTWSSDSATYTIRYAEWGSETAVEDIDIRSNTVSADESSGGDCTIAVIYTTPGWTPYLMTESPERYREYVTCG